MNTYKLLVNQTRRHPTAVSLDAIGPSLAEMVSGAVVRGVSSRHLGYFEIDIRLDGYEHNEAMDRLTQELLRLGVAVVSAEISEWANDEAEWAVAGMLGGGAIGSAGQLLGALAGAAAGAFVGSMIGSTRFHIVTTYDATRSRPWGDWRIVRRPTYPELGGEVQTG
ncbi:MAG TPA: hypothetical protein VG650_11745 [Mycobacteriales bacterium]|nr:hypothetical protein [Mycobacteriales bacterium]